MSEFVYVFTKELIASQTPICYFACHAGKIEDLLNDKSRTIHMIIKTNPKHGLLALLITFIFQNIDDREARQELLEQNRIVIPIDDLKRLISQGLLMLECDFGVEYEIETKEIKQLIADFLRDNAGALPMQIDPLYQLYNGQYVDLFTGYHQFLIEVKKLTEMVKDKDDWVVLSLKTD